MVMMISDGMSNELINATVMVSTDYWWLVMISWLVMVMMIN